MNYRPEGSLFRLGRRHIFILPGTRWLLSLHLLVHSPFPDSLTGPPLTEHLINLHSCCSLNFQYVVSVFTASASRDLSRAQAGMIAYMFHSRFRFFRSTSQRK